MFRNGLLVLLVSMFVAMSGCAASGFAFQPLAERAAPAADAPTPSAAPTAPAEKPVATPAAIDPRKVVYAGFFTIAASDPTSAQDALRAMAEEMGGYLQKLTSNQIIIRVPAARFYPAVASLGRIGAVCSREIRADDVTERHFDLQTRLRNAQALRQKVAQLLEKAPSMKDAVDLERELARIMLEIDQLEGQLNRLANEVAFGTLTINLTTPVRYTPPVVNPQLPFPWLREVGLSRLLTFNGKNLY